MKTSPLRTIIRQILLASVPLAALDGCCSESRESVDLPLVPATRSPADDAGVTSDGGPRDSETTAAPGDAGRTCEEACLSQRFGTCAMVRVTQCNFTEVDGGPGVHCEMTHTSCPQPGVVCGRRPEGFAPTATAPATVDALGALFARMAELEGASIPAFGRLARELATHGAPAALVREAHRAARDEVRHQKMMAALARRHGSVPARARVAGLGRVRPLADVAAENAAEGCVRETFGALLAEYQALHAADPAVRAVMARIAGDETRHAELAWRVAAWADTRLDHADRARVAAARREAVAALLAEVSAEPLADALVRGAGLPQSPRATALAQEAARRLWS